MKATESFLVAKPVDRLVMECVDDARSFRALRREWALLHASCPGATPFNSWEWLYSWWQAYGEGKRLRLLSWRADGVLVGLAPLYAKREKPLVGPAATVLRLVGDSSGDSDYLDFLLRPDWATAVMTDFADWLKRSGDWDAIVLRELPQHSSVPDHLQQLSRDQRLNLRIENGRCAAVDLPPTFDEFLRAKQARFRTKLRALLRRMDEEGLSIDAEDRARSLRLRLRSLFELHQLRWGRAGIVGVFNNTARRRFYAHFVPRFARRGWLRFYSLRRGERYVAHQMCFAMNRVTYLLQEAFDVSEPAASYGQMLRAAVMRDLVTKRESRYDFLGGFSKHKEDWGATQSTIVHVVMARRRLRGQVYFRMPGWQQKAVTIVKSVLPETAVRVLHQARAALRI